MTDNEKIARWAGYIPTPVVGGITNIYYYRHPNGTLVSPPNYSTDAESIQLMDVLVKKGFYPALYYSVENGENVGWKFKISVESIPTIASNIHEAIVKAVLQMIENDS
jgi:hypothetical protein